jgi:FkbM family methyltransferase
MTGNRAFRVRRQSGTRLRFSLFEVLLIAGFVGVVVWYFTDLSASSHPEAQYLADTYGPDRNSEHNEEWILRDFFRDKRGGVFLDVGASHYRRFSNTYYLEQSLGWSGIAVEPLVEFEAEYRQQRPATRFRPFFVSDVSNAQAKLYVLASNPLVSSTDKSFTERYGRNSKELSVPTITLDDLLDSEGVERIDFMSMDIELHEPKALAGFDIARFAPALVCIEGHFEVRQQIIDYFTRHGYVLVGKYLRADRHNLYFAPFDSGAMRSGG